jgi:DNA-binding HxlR family transcriptional regulator
MDILEVWLHLATKYKFCVSSGGFTMKRTSFAKEVCPVAQSLEVVGDWWSLLIVRDAFVGKRRFGEFQKSLGVAKNILTTRLRKLVAGGVLEQVPASDGSAYQEYALTEKGRGLFLVITALKQWGEMQQCDSESEYVLVDQKGRQVRLELRTEDGRRVGLDEVRFVPAKV